MKRLLIGGVVALALSPVFAQSKPETTAGNATPDTPVLTEVQKLQLINAAKDVEIWQLKAQQAASEFEKARTTLQQMAVSMTPDGYVINEKLELVRATTSDATPPAKPPGAP